MNQLIKPKKPYFSSGPCCKAPNWDLNKLKDALLGRSHRSADAISRYQIAQSLTKKILVIPDEYSVAFVPGSCTGAMEAALWNLIGKETVSALAYESFGLDWIADLEQMGEVKKYIGDYKILPDLYKIDTSGDFVFVLNGTTTGMAIKNLDFISDERKGLVFCDASAAAFSQYLDYAKLDIIAFSCQKMLGAEAGFGILVFSPKAMARLQEYKPNRAIPKIFRLDTVAFQAVPINTISLLILEDYIYSLKWAEKIGGLPALIDRVEKNNAVIEEFVNNSMHWQYLVAKENRAKTTQTLILKEEKFGLLEGIIAKLDLENVAYDIASYRNAPKGLRIWTGATVEKEDLVILCRWLDYAYSVQIEKLRYNES